MARIATIGTMNWMMSELEQGAVSLGIAILLHVPSWRLGAGVKFSEIPLEYTPLFSIPKVDTDSQWYCRDECGSNLQAPCDRTSLVDGQVGAEA